MGANASAAIGLTTTVTWMTFYPLYAAGMSVMSCISIALGAKALALTALDLIEQPALLQSIQADHAAAVAAQR